MDEIILGLTIGGVVFGAFVGMLIFLKSFLYICKPNEVVVFEGRKRKLADGRQLEYTVLQKGRGVRIPIIERVVRMDLSTMTVDIQVNNAYSRGNIPLNVHAIANVKICRRPGVIDNALERLLGLDRDEIRAVAKETIEGALRGVISRLTPEQVNEERTTFVHALADDVEEDLNQLGITIDTLNIQSVADSVGYLDNIGRAQIAAVLRDAEVAESDNKREAEQSIADAMARARVAQERAQGNIVRSENDLRKLKADLEARARSSEERTTAAQAEARARAEVQLQEVRTELEKLRLHADEVLPAEAQKRAAELLAEGESAAIAAQGRATAQALTAVGEVWKAAGRGAEDIFVVQQLEGIVQRIADRIDTVEIGNVNLIDGGEGEALGKLAAAYPGMVSDVLARVSDVTGVSFQEILTRVAPPLPKTPIRIERTAAPKRAGDGRFEQATPRMTGRLAATKPTDSAAAVTTQAASGSHAQRSPAAATPASSTQRMTPTARPVTAPSNTEEGE